jgi:tRNA threonylcarbamoyladenosine modification (KEOPS) complex Cgi121 subunit
VRVPPGYEVFEAVRDPGGGGSIHQLLRRVQSGPAAPGSAGDGWYQLLDKRGVAGWRHLASAILHLERERVQRSHRLSDPGAILCLYLAGTHQLHAAMNRVGLSESTREIVVVAHHDPGGRAVLQKEGWTVREPSFPDIPRPETLGRLGIPFAVVERVPERERELLVLEWTALVDLPGVSMGTGTPRP